MTANEIVHRMYQNDAFSQWLGIEIEKVEIGAVELSMRIRSDMTNGFGIAHGGITFSLADSALAFAANSQGRHAVSVETSISHFKPLHLNDLVRATSVERHLGKRTAVYEIQIHRNEIELVALFRGTVYRTDKFWEK